MKKPFLPDALPADAILITCSSHEDRCLGIPSRIGNWRPRSTVLFHYDDPNPRREANEDKMRELLASHAVTPQSIVFSEDRSSRSLRTTLKELREELWKVRNPRLVLDISVFTKRHLLMLFNWVHDEELWDSLVIVYTEPNDYVVSRYIPLSFGLASFDEIPGFPACADVSRPVHLVLFLGYEGDRALAVYEHVEPMCATFIVTRPAFRPDWEGRTEEMNEDLLTINDVREVKYVDGIDPEASEKMLSVVLQGGERGNVAKIVCPLGTKPQALGLYNFVRKAVDPPAIVYASPLRHNHGFYSRGVGPTWLLKEAAR